ncbi:hypothetical protein ABEB36_009556 [Hypothenemus hampei]|uniref:Epoxide hydrolase n=1 Tax=Hypothenemus hampei TaxID=57062 RepID=A0ABD1EGP6_HYPHA
MAFVLITSSLFIVILSSLGLLLMKILTRKPLKKLNENTYWGPGERPKTLDTTIREFEIEVPKEVLEDLQWRLDRLRPLIPPLEGIQQQYGMNTNLLKVVIDYWKNKYNWTERQNYLNQFPQFKTNIQGLDIHYLHVKPQNPCNKKVLPLLILHGWPGSVREFYSMIPILTTPTEDREFVFEVIAPHIPGYGFSQAAAKPGLNPAEIAVIMKNLMNRLGFKKFYCQGGDFGAIILQSLCILYPENVLGFHTNMASIQTPMAYIKYFLGVLYPNWVTRPEHRMRIYPLSRSFKRRLRETGYLHIQATKPDTIGVALTDSPAGLLAYILEKFTTGTNSAWQAREDGGLLEAWNYTDLLDNVMIYWITGSATTSFRLYAETFNDENLKEGLLRHPLQVPTAIARYTRDFYVADSIIDELFPNNVYLSDIDGGHFAAFQLPEVFANDVFCAVDKFEKININK